jgi:hypothetical protein
MKRAACGAALIACVWAAASVQAGLYTDIYQGLYILSTPSGHPVQTALDGTRFNGNRSGRLQIQRNGPGNGYDVQFNRVFGLDSGGRPEVLDVGDFEVQLSGATQATFGYTDRGPLIGTASITANSLNYVLRAKSGIQDATLSGTLNLQEDIQIDQFGFYEAAIEVTNRSSQLTLTGSLAEDTVPTNFDVGPISIKGNVFFDGFVALLSGLGVDTTQLQQLTPGSAIGQIIDDITRQVPALVAGIEVTADGQLPPVPGAIELSQLAQPADVLTVQAGSSLVIPEPGTLLLVALGGMFLVRCSRRR